MWTLKGILIAWEALHHWHRAERSGWVGREVCWAGGRFCGISVAKMTVGTQVWALNPFNHSASFQSSIFDVFWCFFFFLSSPLLKLAFPATKNTNTTQPNSRSKQTNCTLLLLCCCFPPLLPCGTWATCWTHHTFWLLTFLEGGDVCLCRAYGNWPLCAKSGLLWNRFQVWVLNSAWVTPFGSCILLGTWKSGAWRAQVPKSALEFVPEIAAWIWSPGLRVWFTFLLLLSSLFVLLYLQFM